MSKNNIAKAAVLVASLGFTLSSHAGVMLLTSTAQINTTYLNTFESVINSGPVTWDASVSRITASSAASSVTPSGQFGLWDTTHPMTASLSSKYNAVGMYVGNDDFNLQFNAIITVFDGLTNLGSVQIAVNRNDFADQFIGLSSTMAFDSVQITYQRPEAQGLGVYIDDFRLGEAANSVPEPESLALLGIGMLGLAAARRRKKAN